MFGLICNITLRVGFGAIAGMAAYVGTVAAGLFLLLIFYLLIVALILFSSLRLLRERTDAELVCADVSYYSVYLGADSMETATILPILREFDVEYIDGTKPPYKTYEVPGGGQMFKEAEKGEKEVFIERTEDAIETGAEIIATACPYCLVMMTDGIKNKEKEKEVSVLDVAELIARAKDL